MMREHIDRVQQERNHSVRIIMAVLFALFVFFYIVLFQADLIAVMQETWSHGATHNNPVITAIIVAAILLLLQTGLRNLFGIYGRWEAFSYVPSFMLLSFFTDVDTRTFHYHSPTKWIVVLILSFVLVAVVPYFGRLLRQDRKTFITVLLSTNFAVFAVSAILCVALTNHNAPLHMELTAFRYADRERVDRVADVGRRSLETTPSLSALRNVALCRSGRAGDELFTMTQPYGVDGIMPGRYIRHNTRYGSDVWERFVGAEPYGGESAMDFCARLHRSDDSPFSRDLYISALLLDRRLEEFSREFPPQMMGDTLAPRHYREAWLLARHQSETVCADYIDSELEPLLDAFLSIADDPDATSVVIDNRRQLAFGKTYWYYYFHQ